MINQWKTQKDYYLLGLSLCFLFGSIKIMFNELLIGLGYQLYPFVKHKI